ncbi:MAG: hypothetical protein M1827_004088 [Pycnora praestabilis]|nr:MAG: hypothetical protein M1827_004088 [Pycnora praestabilis]
MAGLRCADVLTQNGVKVTILEGRDRIGGRVHQSNHLGHSVDLGPNWIHGTDHNPIMDLAIETNTATHSWGERQSMFDKRGSPIDEKRTGMYSELAWGIIAKAFTYSNDNSASIPARKSLLDFFEKEVKDEFIELDGAEDSSISNESTTGSPEKDRETLLRVAEMWGAFVGSPIERQSLKFFWLEECIEGENLFVASTYKAILHRVAKVALAKADVQLENKVAKIESRESSVVVTTTTGVSQTFDEVVVTAPLGWLKRNKESFLPKVPPRLSKAIDSISYGQLDKVYITFPKAFWQSSPTNTTSSTYPGFTHWLHPLYATPSPNPHAWNQEALSLASLPSPNAHPTLLFYIYGPTSQHIGNIVTSTPPSKLDAALTKFFEPYYSRLPNYSSTDPFCKPTGLLATAWCNDDLAGYGSYSNFQVGLEEGDVDIQTMRHGMPERRVWIAGEHTAPFVALGTVTGAYWSGEGVARRIVDSYGLDRVGDREERSGGAEAKAKGKEEGISDAGQMNGMGL